MPTQVNLGRVVGSTGPTGPTGPAPIKGTDYWTEEDQESIIDQAAQAAAGLVSGNIPKRTVSDLMAHGEDAYAQKPIEVRVKGKTWVNRWPVISGTNNGITVSTDESGLITVTGTSTGDSYVYAIADWIQAGVNVTCKLNITAPTDNTWTPYIEIVDSEGAYIQSGQLDGTTTIPSNAAGIRCGVHAYIGQTVNVSFRVMLVEGSEAPDCFTPPASITSVQAGNLVTAGKNLAIETDFTLNPSSDGTRIQVVSNELLPGEYYVKCSESTNTAALLLLLVNASGKSEMYFSANPRVGAVISVPRTGLRLQCYMQDNVEDKTDYSISNFQLELGSMPTSYEPPNVTTTPLPEVELRGLPNGTADELVIKADGTCEVERQLKRFDSKSSGWKEYSTSGELAYISISAGSGKPASGWHDVISELPVVKSVVADDTLIAPHWAYNGSVLFFRFPATEASNLSLAISYMESVGAYCYAETSMATEPQSLVTLPVLPAPTFNQYHDSGVPSDTSVEYARDINIVLANLEAVQKALLGGE